MDLLNSIQQISDIDAQRCRKGRLNYLGFISFALIAVPMTFIVVNDMVGNAMVDGAVPALYSGILLLGAYLYSISLTVLLVTFILLMMALNYWAFVYRPASLAHSRRKSKVRGISYGDSLSSSVTRMRWSVSSGGSIASSTPRSASASSHMWRIINILKRSVQHGITLCSLRRTRHAKSLAMNQIWCSMNRSNVHQGTVITGQNMYPDTPPKKSSRRPSKLQKQLSMNATPSCITCMMTATSAQEDKIESSMVGLFSGKKSTENVLAAPDQLVVTRMGGACTNKGIRFQMVFNSREFLSSLKSKLVCSSVNYQNDEPLLVDEEDLFKTYVKLLNVFYPDGVALSVVEKWEACELCRQWIDSKIDENDDTSYYGVNGGHMVMFSVFEEWFIRVIMSSIKHALSDRLLDISLRHTLNATKRLALSTNHIVKSPIRRPTRRVYSLRIEPVSALKIEPVTPSSRVQSMRIENCSPRTPYGLSSISKESLASI